jgi:hypothetical protein
MPFIGNKPTAVPLSGDDIQDGTIGLADLSATGTKDATTFLRGDNTFASAGGNNTPAFHAYLSSNQTITSGTMTKPQFDTEIVDTDGCFDNSTNYRFTPTTAGKYFIYAQVKPDVNGGSEFQYAYFNIRKNGSDIIRGNIDFRNGTGGYSNGLLVNGIVDANGSSDYFEVFGEVGDSVTGSAPRFKGGSTIQETYFGAYKLIGV